MGKEDVEEKHVKRTQKDYTLDFKLRVVRELETSHISMNAISRKYGIQGESTVSRWLEKYGARDADGNVAALMFRKKRPLSGLEQRNLVLEHELSLLREKLKQKGYKEAFYEEVINNSSITFLTKTFKDVSDIINAEKANNEEDINFVDEENDGIDEMMKSHIEDLTSRGS